MQITFVQQQVSRFGISEAVVMQRQLNTLSPAIVAQLRQGQPPDFPRLYESLLVEPEGALLDERLALFASLVCDFMERAYAGISHPPDDVIHVTCSGYLAPSPVERYFSHRNWISSTITHSYHMGCYGAFPAARMAAGFLANAHLGFTPPKTQVDIVHSEFLSMHMNTLRQGAADIITMSLFADGFIKYSAYTGAEAARLGLPGLKVLAFAEKLLPNSPDEMTWTPNAYQFEMSLSRLVPIFIRDAIGEFVVALCRDAGIDFEAEKASMAFAIHPGGPKIVDHIQAQLGICPQQVAISHHILRQHGNMSSATVPYIWGEMVKDAGIPPGTKILSVAFGPGLTATGLLLEKV